MQNSSYSLRRSIVSMLLFACGLTLSLIQGANAAEYKVALSGANEVPAVMSPGSGSGSITINDDMTVSGSVTTTGIEGTMAHIHDAAKGKNGPVIIPLVKSGNTYSVPAGAKLTAEQFADYKAGNLYVNVHTAEHPGGDMRAQLSQ